MDPVMISIAVCVLAALGAGVSVGYNVGLAEGARWHMAHGQHRDFPGGDSGGVPLQLSIRDDGLWIASCVPVGTTTYQRNSASLPKGWDYDPSRVPFSSYDGLTKRDWIWEPICPKMVTK